MRGLTRIPGQICFQEARPCLISEFRLKQGLAPEFFTRGGEVKPIPKEFGAAVKAVTTGVSCVNCRHCHGLIDKLGANESVSSDVISIDS